MPARRLPVCLPSRYLPARVPSCQQRARSPCRRLPARVQPSCHLPTFPRRIGVCRRAPA